MTTAREIQAVKSDLDAWIVQQRNADVIAAARHVWHSLSAAQIGAPHPKIVERLAEDVAKLAQAKGDGLGGSL
jgi:hypothetical protein